MESRIIHESIIKDQIDEIIGAIIKARKKKKITQAELAKIVGINRSTITRLESFSFVPTLPVILSIFKALDISFNLSFKN